MSTSKSKERARLIRRIIVANILSLPLKRYIGLIKKIEMDPLFQRLIRKRPQIISVKKFPKTLYRCAPVSCNCAASIENHSPPIIVFHHKGLDREYLIDVKNIDNYINKNSFTESELKRITYITNKLELISTRNRMCYWILRGTAHLQNGFFKSGELLDLKTLSQIRLKAWISGRGNHNPIIDESRISRLISALSINVNCSNEIPLKKLFPTKRALLKRLVSDLIISERKELESGRLKELYTDAQIALKLRSFNVSRRTVTHCRKDLGIPNRHERAKNCGYRHITQNYSPPHVLSRSTVKKCPATSGVYELSIRNLDIEYTKGQSRVFYIGCGKNIRARIREHMRTGTPNGVIRKFIANNRCMFRYKLITKGWKLEEKKLYHIFKDTYGNPPKANRISP